MNSVTTKRVGRKIREQLDKNHAAQSKPARKAPGDEARRTEKREAERSAEELGTLLTDSPDEKIVESVKKDRRGR